MRIMTGLAALAAGIAAPALAAETVTYSYDVHGRLTKVERTRTVADEVDTTYEHDAADNRTEKVVTVTPG